MKISKNTKKGADWIVSYNLSTDDVETNGDIYKVYTRPSLNKIFSLHKHIEYINSIGGYGIKILSHNSSSYVLGYLTEKDNIKYLNIITYKNHYKIEL